MKLFAITFKLLFLLTFNAFQAKPIQYTEIKKYLENVGITQVSMLSIN